MHRDVLSLNLNVCELQNLQVFSERLTDHSGASAGFCGRRSLRRQGRGRDRPGAHGWRGGQCAVPVRRPAADEAADGAAEASALTMAVRSMTESDRNRVRYRSIQPPWPDRFGPRRSGLMTECAP